MLRTAPTNQIICADLVLHCNTAAETRNQLKAGTLKKKRLWTGPASKPIRLQSNVFSLFLCHKKAADLGIGVMMKGRNAWLNESCCQMALMLVGLLLFCKRLGNMLISWCESGCVSHLVKLHFYISLLCSDRNVRFRFTFTHLRYIFACRSRQMFDWNTDYD